MMRKTATILILTCLLATAAAQSAREEIASNLRLSASNFMAYMAPQKPLTAAPEGMKPFYISHYGRHGSRYAWNAKTYSLIHEVLSAAHEAGVLTPLGEQFYQDFEPFYETPLINTGDLVPLGWEQHQKIAAWMYDTFPKVFKGSRHVDAIVSTSARSIISMNSFCLSLKEKNPKLSFYESSTHTGLSVVTPTSAPAPIRKKYQEDDISHVEPVAHFNARFIDYDGILGRIFTDPAFPSKFEGGRTNFLDQLYSLIGGYHNYEERPLFDQILTPDQYAMLWEALNYYSWHIDLTARYQNIPLLEDIIAKAEAAFNDPNRAADLRFGHDYVFEAFMCLINVNGSGTVPEKASEVKYWFQSYNVPMAATMLFVFYRNNKGDILFKVMQNEAEATLPQLQPVTGPYYRWTDFTRWAASMMAEHPLIEQ